MDSDKVTSIATASGAGAAIAGIGLTQLAMYALVGVAAGAIGYGIWKISVSGFKRFSTELKKEVEKKAAEAGA